MSRAVAPVDQTWQSQSILAISIMLFAIVAAFCAGCFPLQYSIAIVFLFAGPHNWIEARYFLTRLPPKLGRLRRFFSVAAGGIVLLAVAHAAIPFASSAYDWSRSTWMFALAAWFSVLVAWTLWLILLRSKQGPRRDWSNAIPFGFLIISLSWLYPTQCLLSLVYLHPLVGLWVLDRELKANHPNLLTTYRSCLSVVPLCVLGLCASFAGSSELPIQDELSMWIVNQVGANQISFLSSHFLVATHAFLEMLHYAVWLVAIPLASGRVFSLDWASMPLARRSGNGRRLITGLLSAGAMLVVVLWVAFCLDYTVTRQVYFQVAMLHVLAEIPFLLRLL